jgi:uncharacterized protein YndB with AHSA1/START domain
VQFVTPTQALASPEHLWHFLGPTGTTTPACGITVGLRPGGVFETTMINDADGSQYAVRAVYAEVRRPDRLVSNTARHTELYPPPPASTPAPWMTGADPRWAWSTPPMVTIVVAQGQVPRQT